MKKSITDQRGVLHLPIIIAIVAVVGVTGAIAWRLHDNQQRASLKASQEVADRAAKLASQKKASLKKLASTPTEKKQTTDALPAPASKPATTQPKTTTPATSKPKTSTPSATTTPPKVETSPTYPGDNGDTPQVTLTYPSFWGQTVSGTITMTATASDSSGVKKVIFMIRKIGQAAAVYTQYDYDAPYSAQYDTTQLPNGGSDYTVEAQVFDNAGHGNLASHRINIQN